ncbi:MAG: hypothetical protein J0H02_03425 [Armatimonadetes bacterium]|nr:hypothetical protein [Armatimonadota bacterium]
MKFIYAAALGAILVIAGCTKEETQSASSPETPSAVTVTPATHEPAIGSQEWMKTVDEKLGISSDGHGPDFGSDEWNRAVESKIHTADAEGNGPKIGTEEWKRSVDFKLKNKDKK